MSHALWWAYALLCAMNFYLSFLDKFFLLWPEWWIIKNDWNIKIIKIKIFFKMFDQNFSKTTQHVVLNFTTSLLPEWQKNQNLKITFWKLSIKHDIFYKFFSIPNIKRGSRYISKKFCFQSVTENLIDLYHKNII